MNPEHFELIWYYDVYVLLLTRLICPPGGGRETCYLSQLFFLLITKTTTFLWLSWNTHRKAGQVSPGVLSLLISFTKYILQGIPLYPAAIIVKYLSQYLLLFTFVGY